MFGDVNWGLMAIGLGYVIVAVLAAAGFKDTDRLAQGFAAMVWPFWLPFYLVAVAGARLREWIDD